MTTKEMIEVMQAYERGEQIEYRYAMNCGGWCDVHNPLWNWGDYNYRVKPQSKRWRAEKGNIYYFVCTDGIVRFTLDAYSKIDNSKYNVGNYFETKEEAQVFANKFKDLFKEKHNG